MLQKEGAHFYFPELNKKFVVYDKASLYMFTCNEKGGFRYRIVWLTCWPVFENFINFMILVNSLFLAAYDYEHRPPGRSKWNDFIEKSGQAFSIIFISEAVFKIIAMGFFVHKNAYLRDAWNWLDFIVVCIAIIEYTPIPSANLKALRTMRVLRPLRSINAFPSMRRLIGSLLASLPSLGNVVVFMFFIFLLFGILGV